MPEHYFFYDLIFSILFYNFVKTTHIMKTLFIKSIVAIIMALLISTVSFAQEITVNGTAVLRSSSKATQNDNRRTITGTVTCDGIPVPDATVKADAGNGITAHTNEKGEYKISIPKEGATLTFYCWSMEPLTIDVKDQTVVDVAMKEIPSTCGIPEGETLPPDANIVKGTVTEINGCPIIGAYVGVVGTKRSVSTNWRGKFEIAVPKGKKLRFSMIGYKTVEVRVKGRDSINIELEGAPVYLD